MNRIRVGVIFGGRSGEHEVSLRSAESILKAIDRNKYDVVPITISHEGQWDPFTLAAAPQTEPAVDVIFPILHGTYGEDGTDRKSTRLNSSHLGISYAVFCLKKKN